MFEPDDFYHALIVSCQAAEGSPLNLPEAMALMAVAAAEGGARGIRANGPDHIAAIKAAVALPVIGLLKRHIDGYPVYITSSLADAESIANAGADLIAIDATFRPRPGGATPGELISHIRNDLGLPVVADIDCVAAASAAAEAGATFVATTLSGYTGPAEMGSIPLGPDIDLVSEIAQLVSDCPVIAEGRYQFPQQLAEAFRAGAFAVVVGEAITNPTAATRRFASAIPR